MVSAAVSNGVQEWFWHVFRGGVLFEVAYDSEQSWPEFLTVPAVHAALDAAPDPVNGLLIYRGRGGNAGRAEPRRPRPTAGAGAVPVPHDETPSRVTLATAEPTPTTAGVTV